MLSCRCAVNRDQQVPATVDGRSELAPQAPVETACRSITSAWPPMTPVAPVRTAPLRGSPLDLTTLYSALLI